MLSVEGWKRRPLSTTVWVLAERAVDAAAPGSPPATANANASAAAAARADAAARRARARPARRSGKRTVITQGGQPHQRRRADAGSRHHAQMAVALPAHDGDTVAVEQPEGHASVQPDRATAQRRGGAREDRIADARAASVGVEDGPHRPPVEPVAARADRAPPDALFP